MAKGPLWTEPEDKIIRRLYPDGGVGACARRLPGRGHDSIRSRASKLGVHTPHRRKPPIEVRVADDAKAQAWLVDWLSRPVIA